MPVPDGSPTPAFFQCELTPDSPTFVNPNGSTAGSGIHHYHVQQFTVSADGVYTIESASPNTTGTPSNALDTFLRVYANAFNPGAPAGALAFNDDFTGALTVLPGPYAGTISATATGFQGAQPSSRLAAVSLTAGTPYFLVNTSFRQTNFVPTGTQGQPIGPFYTGIGGPGDVTLVGTPCPGGGTDPEIEVTPSSFSFEVTAGGTDSDQMSIANVGGGTLVWDIDTDSLPTGAQRSHDPALDETLAIPNFVVDSPANGGSPAVFTVPAGVLTSGQVVGFSFQGTVSGITGNSSWASDMCMRIEGPDGSSYAVGGFSGTASGCNVNSWDFSGSGSTDDGTYGSVHDDVWPFPPGAQDAGDWTITFINDWNSTSAATMSWTGVTVTLHKIIPPEPCSDPNTLPWLSVSPDSGSTAGGSSSPVDVLIDTDGLAPGSYEAYLCVNSNDSVGNDLVVVPVDLTVTAPQITVDPESISAAADPGNSTTATLAIGNAGAGDLFWELEEAQPNAVQPTGSGSVGEPADTRSAARYGLPSDEAVMAYRRAREMGTYSADSDIARSLGVGALPSTPLATLGGFDCDGAPGLVINDDGTLENGYGFNAATVTIGEIVDKLTPPFYPATFKTVCIAFVRNAAGGPTLNFEIVVYDDDGPGGTPGTALGALPFSISDIPLFAAGPGAWHVLDISSLALNVTSGSVYIGARWNPANSGGQPGRFFAVDESPGTPVNGGFFQANADGLWLRLGVDLFPDYRAMLVRTQASAPSCDVLEDIPWLSASPTIGQIASGDPDTEVTVTLDATSLSDGVYHADLCVFSNDPARPVVAVPVEFVVGVGNQADLGLSLFGVPSTVNAGGNVDLIAAVANFGPASASGVTVELELPAPFTFVSGRLIQGSGDWNCSAAGSLVTCAMDGALPPGQFAAVLQVNVAVDANAPDGTVQTDGMVSSTGDDPNPGNNTASVTTTIVGMPDDVIFANGFDCAPGFPDCQGGGTPGIYTDRTTFLQNVQPGFYEENFASVPGGDAGPSMSFSGNGFAYTITAAGAGTNNLYNDPGVISHDSAVDRLVVTFTGNPVTAVGGNFWATDIAFVPTGTQITITLSDGTVETYTSSGPTNFRGFVTPAPITSISIDAPDVPVNAWSTMDNLIVGQ